MTIATRTMASPSVWNTSSFDSLDERGGVVRDLVVQARREPALQLGHLVAHPLGGVDGVGAGQLVHGQRDRRVAVEGAALVVAERAELRSVATSLSRTGRPSLSAFRMISPNCRVIDQPALRVDRVLERLAPRGRRLAHLPGRDLRVLLLDRPQHVRRRQLLDGHLLRVQPHPHRVVALAQVGDVADALQPGEFVPQLDGRVVAQVQQQVLPPLLVLRRRGRALEVDDHELAGRLLLDGHPAPLDEVGQHRFGQVDPVLHQHLGDVQVDARLERDGERVRPVVRRTSTTCTSCPRRRSPAARWARRRCRPRCGRWRRGTPRTPRWWAG